MRKLISLLLCFCVIIIAFPFSASAVTDDYDSAYEVIVQGIYNFEEKISIEEYNITIEVFETLYNDIVANEPLLFNTQSCKYGYYNNQILYVRPTYTMTQDEYDVALAFVEDEINLIFADMPEGLDDYEKALYLHDYIALNYCYDLTYEIRTLYGFLKEKTGVCASYTLLYDELLTRLGIENYAVQSESLNHVWNQIKINDNWYHVDITWDDPISSYDVTDKGYFGRVWHDDFLCSDEKFSDSHSDDFVTKYPCTDTTFDYLTWKESNYPVGFANGNTYVLNNDNIRLLDLLTDELTNVFDTNSQMHHSEANGRYYMNLPYFGSYGDKLIYHTGESLMSYDPLTLTSEVLETPVTDDKITLMYVTGNTVHYIIGTSNTSVDGEEYVYTLTKLEIGDVNGDDSISVLDYIALKRAVMDGTELSVPSKVWDINGDGLCSILDYVTLKRLVMGTFVLN